MPYAGAVRKKGSPAVTPVTQPAVPRSLSLMNTTQKDQGTQQRDQH